MIDKAQYRLLSGDQSLDCFSVGDFALVATTLQLRLLESLCMTAPPDDDDDDMMLWNQLLADALAISVDVKADQGISSESMRNYSYQLRDYANSWSMLALKSGDLLNKFNVCETGIMFQSNVSAQVYGPEPYCYYGDES